MILTALLLACGTPSTAPREELDGCLVGAVRSPPLQVRVAPSFSGTDPERAQQQLHALAERARLHGVHLDLTDDLAVRTGSPLGVRPGEGSQTAPLEAYVAEGRPPSGVLRLWITRDIVDPRSALAARVRLRGLGLHPDTLGHAAALGDALGNAPFDPVVLLEIDADTATAMHELGHALGLEHGGEPGNVMHEARMEGCVETFTRDQVEALALP